MKVVLGIIIGVFGFILIGVVSCTALVGGAVSSLEEPSTEEAQIEFTATEAGTVTDFVGDTYTVLELKFQNDSEDETIQVHVWDFSVELADGSVKEADTYSGGLENPLETVDVGPGQSTTGQIAVSGEVDVAKVQWDNDIFSDDKEIAEVK